MVELVYSFFLATRTLPNHSLPQKIAGIFVSGPGKRGELNSSDHMPGR